ncbi:MAG TPA: hypothetical protein VLB27_03100, partial [candidate division Zixibacteria bacterium]|nr:hypothetical protein [candidate division Zixibacteria bacterium]
MIEFNRELKALEKSLLTLAAVLLLARFVNLHYDTPLFFSHYGQSEITDPYMYTSFPRNAELFDSWDPYHYERWSSWRVSLSALAAYPAFLIAGVSRTAANVSSVALQTLGLALFVLGWRRRRTAAEAAWLALFLAASTLLFTTSRAPFLENGLIFTSGALFYLYARLGDVSWAPAACGALIAIGAFSGKLVSLALCAPLVVDYFISGRRRAVQNLVGLCGGLTAVTVLYAALFYDGFIAGMLAYYTEQLGSVGLAPMADKSPGNLLEALLSFGATGGMSRFEPFVIALALVGAVLVVSRLLEGKSDERRALRAPLFALVWLAAGALPLVPFEYRPYRYLEPLILPLAALAAVAVTALLASDLRLSLRSRRRLAPALLSLG